MVQTVFRYLPITSWGSWQVGKFCLSGRYCSRLLVSTGRRPMVTKVIAFQAKANMLFEEPISIFLTSMYIFFGFFRLEKPYFHNRRIYSAERTNPRSSAWKAEQFMYRETSPQQVAIRYSAVGCNSVKKYRISFVQFGLIWIELSVYQKISAIYHFK